MSEIIAPNSYWSGTAQTPLGGSLSIRLKCLRYISDDPIYILCGEFAKCQILQEFVGAKPTSLSWLNGYDKKEYEARKQFEVVLLNQILLSPFARKEIPCSWQVKLLGVLSLGYFCPVQDSTCRGEYRFNCDAVVVRPYHDEEKSDEPVIVGGRS